MSRGASKIRPERVAERIRVEIADILRKDLKDPRIGLVTCTRVQVTGDLRMAKIYVSILAGSAEQKGAIKALGHASGYVRRLLGQRLGLRASPEVRFVFDPAVEYGIRLEELIEENKQRSPDESEEEGQGNR